MKDSSPLKEPEEDENYLDYYLKHRSVEKGTARAYSTAWKHLQKFCEQKGYATDDVGVPEVQEFCNHLKQIDGLGERTAEDYVVYLRAVCGWLLDRGVINYNPFAIVLEDDDPFSYPEETVKKQIPLDELREALRKADAFMLVFLVILLKTGIRVGEAVNLDYRDIHLDHPISESMPKPRKEIINRPDSIYIDSSISEGEVHNGELRKNANKPESFRPIPIDSELKQTLVWHIAMSQKTEAPHPLLRAPCRISVTRLTRNRANKLIREFSDDMGWIEGGENYFTAHWCRHWFSTTLENNISQDAVKVGTVADYVGALRGDTDSRTISTYRQGHWGDDKWKRTAYESGIPSLIN